MNFYQVKYYSFLKLAPKIYFLNLLKKCLDACLLWRNKQPLFKALKGVIQKIILMKGSP